VSNGNALLDNIDGRSTRVRRYRDVLNELISDMGGDPSGAQTAIARRAACVSSVSKPKPRCWPAVLQPEAPRGVSAFLQQVKV